MAKLPFDLTTQILHRLPAKSLVRFRCISKDWASLLAHPHFTKFYCQQQQNLQLIVRDGLLYSLDCVSLDCALRVDHLLKDTGFTVKKVLGCSNGLVCLSVSSMFTNSVVVEEKETVEVDDDEEDHEIICTTDYIDDIIVICNLSSGAHHIVPSSPIVFKEEGLSLGMRWDFRRRFSYWFGFDSSCNDYKLVRISQYIYNYFPDCEDDILSEINVYTMKTNSWTRIHLDMDNYCIAFREPVLVSGALHWIACIRRGLRCNSWFLYDRPTVILAFDIAHGVYSFREVSINNVHKDCYKFSLGSMGGRLCAMCADSDIKFFMMEEYGNSNSWNLMASLPYPGQNFSWFAKSFSYDKALAFSKSGGKVLVEQDKDNFLCCDLTKETVNKSMVHFISFERPKKRKLRD